MGAQYVHLAGPIGIPTSFGKGRNMQQLRNFMRNFGCKLAANSAPVIERARVYARGTYLHFPPQTYMPGKLPALRPHELYGPQPHSPHTHAGPSPKDLLYSCHTARRLRRQLHRVHDALVRGRAHHVARGRVPRPLLDLLPLDVDGEDLRPGEHLCHT